MPDKMIYTYTGYITSLQEFFFYFKNSVTILGMLDEAELARLFCIL
jgi:hypothetical protein